MSNIPKVNLADLNEGNLFETLTINGKEYAICKRICLLSVDGMDFVRDRVDSYLLIHSLLMPEDAEHHADVAVRDVLRDVRNNWPDLTYVPMVYWLTYEALYGANDELHYANDLELVAKLHEINDDYLYKYLCHGLELDNY